MIRNLAWLVTECSFRLDALGDMVSGWDYERDNYSNPLARWTLAPLSRGLYRAGCRLYGVAYRKLDG